MNVNSPTAARTPRTLPLAHSTGTVDDVSDGVSGVAFKAEGMAAKEGAGNSEPVVGIS